MSLPFNPATDIYVDSDYAQQVVNQYQGNRYYVPGFNSGDHPLAFAENHGRGYYRYADDRSGTTALLATGTALLTGKLAIPFSRRNLGHNLDVYENSRAYSQGRMRQLQQMAHERANRMARSVALQRNRFYGAEQQERLARMFDNVATSVLLSGAQATMPPEIFEALFGRAGSGMGMYDAAYSQSTYRLKGDGSRWSPGERLRYASQATSMLYLDPFERRRRVLDSVEGGRLWSSLEAMGLLGGNEADFFDQPPEETVKSAIGYFRDTEVSPYASERTRDLHEKVQKRQAINDRRRELAELRDIINSPLDDDQKLEAIREYRQKSSELLRLEKDSGIKPHSEQDRAPADLSKATAAMQNLQAHYNKRAGRDQETFDQETERLALIAQKEIIDANLGAVSGHSIDLNNLGDDKTRQRIVSSLERAQTSREQYIQAERQTKAPLTEQDISVGTERHIRAAGERFSHIVNDPDRDAGMSNSRKLDDLLLKAQKVFEIQARGGTAPEVEEARRKALESAGGGTTGELVLQMANRKLLGQSLDLRSDDPETREIVKRSIQAERTATTESARLKMDEELLRGGFRSRDWEKVDLTDLPLEEIVSLSETIIAAQDDPRLAEWLKNSAMINSKKGRWAEYEKAIKALQEAITDKNASPSKLLETLHNFAGGNLHQMDVTQLKRTVQQTYSLARQLGQGDEYVEASMGQSQQMLAALGINRAFTGWHGMQGLAHKAAVLETPEYLGVWGAQSSAETTAVADSHRAAWLQSDVANQWGAAMKVKQVYGDFRGGSSADNYMKALQHGDSTFERITTDAEGNRRSEQWSVQMSETQWRQVVAESLDTDDPDRIKAARSSLGAVLSNRSANQKAIYDSPDQAAVVQHAHSAAQFTTSVARASRASTARGFVSQKAAELIDAQGITATERGRVLQQVYLEMADRMLDSDQVERIVRESGIDREDPYFIGKIGAALQKETFENMLRTAPKGSVESKVAEAYVGLMADQKDADEMAVPIQHLLDEIGFNTGHQNAVNALKNLSRKVAAGQQVQSAVAAEEQRQKDAYSEGFSPSMLARFSESLSEGATFEEIINAVFQTVDLDPESDLMQVHRDFKEANARVRRLDIERSQLLRNRNLSEEDRERLLIKNAERRKAAIQNLGDAQATLQPELLAMRLGFEKMSTAEFDAKFGMDLDLLNQVVTVEDGPGGRFKLRKLKKDEVRIDAESGMMQVREGQEWVDKQDAAYFAQMTRKSAEGEEEYYFKELFRENGRWKYLDDEGSLAEFDPTAEGSKMAVGTKILTRAQDGSVKASNYQWTNGFLTKTSDDGRATIVATDTEGQFIRMDSELGKAVYTSSDDGVLNQDLIQAIENSQSDLVTIIDAKTLSRGKAAQRHTAAAADESKTSARERKIRELANQYVDSTGAIGEIEPVKVEMEGEAFYMLSGYGKEESRRAEWEKYREAQTKQKAEITAYFEADDSEVKKFVQNENEELRETRKAYRANKAIRERLQGRIAANKAKTPLDETEAQAIHEEIRKDEQTLRLLAPVGESTIEQAAKEQARLERVDVQSEQVRDISEAAISTTLTDPKLLDAVYQYGGSTVKNRDRSYAEQRFTAVELADLIGSLREAAKSLPAVEQGAMDVHIEELTRKKTAVQHQAAQTLKEIFSEQGGVQVVDIKTADPVRKDRFGDPLVVTPVPPKEPLETVTEPTDIRQLPIDSGTYNATTGAELNTPVRAVEKRAIEVPRAVAIVPMIVEPDQEPQRGKSKVLVVPDTPPVTDLPTSEVVQSDSSPQMGADAMEVTPISEPSPIPSITPQTPEVVTIPGPPDRSLTDTEPPSPPQTAPAEAASSTPPLKFKEKHFNVTEPDDVLAVPVNADEPTLNLLSQGESVLPKDTAVLKPTPSSGGITQTTPTAQVNFDVSDTLTDSGISLRAPITDDSHDIAATIPEPVSQPLPDIGKLSTVQTIQAEITTAIPPLAFKERPFTTDALDNVLDSPINIDESAWNLSPKEEPTTTLNVLEDQPRTIPSLREPTHRKRRVEAAPRNLRRGELSSLDLPLRKRPDRIVETLPSIQIDDNLIDIVQTDSERIRSTAGPEFNMPGNLSEPPAISQMSTTVLPSGPNGSAREYTLQADTVHLRVDSMDLKNGSVVVETVGRGHRSGTSEQR